MNIKVEKIAKELLLEEDCVVIPEFGGFVSNYRPAIVEPSKNILLPPGKHISFNAKLSKNDGLLAKAISERLGISYKDALVSVATRVEFWRKELETKHYLEFEDLGSFILNKEGSLVFEQFNEANFSDTSFGLTNVHAIPVERLGIGKKIEKEITKKKAQPNLMRKVARYGSVAAAFLGLFFLGYNLDTISDSSVMDMFSFGETEVTEPKVDATEKVAEEKPTKALEKADIEKFFEPEEIKEFEDYGHLAEEKVEVVEEIRLEKERARIEVEGASEVEEVAPIVEEVTETVPLEVSSSYNYHVIAGCFSKKRNAKKMLKKLQALGYDAKMAGQSSNGLYRVAYGSYNNHVEALKALAKAKLNHNSKAWMAKD